MRHERPADLTVRCLLPDGTITWEPFEPERDVPSTEAHEVASTDVTASGMENAIVVQRRRSSILLSRRAKKKKAQRANDQEEGTLARALPLVSGPETRQVAYCVTRRCPELAWKEEVLWSRRESSQLGWSQGPTAFPRAQATETWQVSWN